MRKTSASAKTLYPYERRRRGRWRFLGPIGVLSMLLLVPLPAQALPTDNLVPVELFPEHMGSGDWECRSLGHYEHELRGFHDWIIDGATVVHSNVGTIYQRTHLTECTNHAPCSSQQIIGYYRVTVETLTVTDPIAYLRPDVDLSRNHEYTCYNKDHVTNKAYRDARMMQDIEACAVGGVGSSVAYGFLVIQMERPLYPFGSRGYYTVSFDGYAHCGASPHVMMGEGPVGL